MVIQARRGDLVCTRTLVGVLCPPYVPERLQEIVMNDELEQLRERVEHLEHELELVAQHAPGVPNGPPPRSSACLCTTSPRVPIRPPEKSAGTRGVIAIGDIATGVLAFGGVACGLVAVGGLAVGGICIGGVALGLLLGVGGVATAGWHWADWRSAGSPAAGWPWAITPAVAMRWASTCLPPNVRIRRRSSCFVAGSPGSTSGLAAGPIADTSGRSLRMPDARTDDCHGWTHGWRLKSQYACKSLDSTTWSSRLASVGLAPNGTRIGGSCFNAGDCTRAAVGLVPAGAAPGRYRQTCSLPLLPSLHVRREAADVQRRVVI